MTLKHRDGFTLLELLIALSLSTMVLLAVFAIMTSMARFQVEGLRKGTVNGWSLASVVKMNKELEEANVLNWPTTAGDDYLVGCTNWSHALSPGRIDASADVTVFYYCYDGAADGLMRRYADSGPAVTCPPMPPAASPPLLPPCDGSGSWTQNDVIATGVNRLSGALVFTRDNSVGGVHVRFVVGDPTYVAGTAGKLDLVNPQFFAVDTRIPMAKQYLNSSD